MNRRWLSTCLALLSLLLATPVAAAQCPAKVFFGNGIDTQEEDARWAAASLRAHINVELIRQGLPRIDKACVLSAYATDVGKVRGIVNTADQLFQEERFTRIWRALAALEPESDEIRAALKALLQQSIDVQLNDPQTGPDLRTQLSDYWDSIAVDDEKVIVVAHSQGNAFANAAFDLLRAGYDIQHPAIDPLMFSIVAVATPADHVATGEQYTTLLGDGIFLALGLPPNTNPEGTPCIDGGLHPVLCHSFLESYLRGLHSEPRIIRQVIDSFPANKSPAAGFLLSSIGYPDTLSSPPAPALPMMTITAGAGCACAMVTADGGVLRSSDPDGVVSSW